MRNRFGLLTIVIVGLLCACSGNLLLEPIGTDSDLTIRMRSLWVVGGLSGNGTGTVVPQLDAFDPETQTWYSAAATFRAGYERSFAGVVGYKGKIYVIGGFDSTGVVTNTTQIYDIATDTWSDGAVMLEARANITAVVSDGYIYVLNGSYTNATANWAARNVTYRYTVQDDQWNTRTVPGVTCSNLSAYRLGGTIYSIGGRSGAAAIQTLHNGYVPFSSLDYLTTTTETAITAKVGFAADVYTNEAGVSYLITVGGVTTMTGVTGNYVFHGSVNITAYNPTVAVQYLAYPFTGVWATAAQSLPDALGYGEGLIEDSVFYYMGGTSTGTTSPNNPPVGLSAVYYSDLTAFPSNTWQSGPAMPRGRYGHSLVKILEN